MCPYFPSALKEQGRSSHLDQRGQLYAEGHLIGAVAIRGGMLPIQDALAGRELKKQYPFLTLLPTSDLLWVLPCGPSKLEARG